MKEDFRVHQLYDPTRTFNYFFIDVTSQINEWQVFLFHLDCIWRWNSPIGYKRNKIQQVAHCCSLYVTYARESVFSDVSCTEATPDFFTKKLMRSRVIKVWSLAGVVFNSSIIKASLTCHPLFTSSIKCLTSMMWFLLQTLLKWACTTFFGGNNTIRN